ncbi:MAG: lyase family protein [Chloroflexi bacterium]|nr:lyase family protein [Chloroflexota bacterium]
MKASGSQYAEGVGGRLGAAKSASYERAVGRVEGRANPFVARYMLASDLAYVLSAGELGLTPRPVVRSLIVLLLDLLDKAETLDYRDAATDIVVQREAWVIEQLGPAVGGWLHLGRSRGESIRAYIPRLFFRQTLHEERLALITLANTLIGKAEPGLEWLAPSFHHLQHASITTLGEYLLSWVSTFLRHVERLEQAGERLDFGPASETSRPNIKELNDRVCRRLGFRRRGQARREGIWCEDQFSEPFFFLVLISVDLARLAEDLRLWMTPEFRFFEIADQHASGSSNLPQKKNPFGLEAVIGGAALGAGRLAGQLAANVTPSDESDALFHAGSLYQHAKDVTAWTSFMADVIEEGSFNAGELREKLAMGYVGAGEARDILVYDHGVPNRAAHRALGLLVRAESENQPPPNISAFVKEETGLDIQVDAAELDAVVRAERIPPTVVDLPLIRQRYEELAKDVEMAQRAVPSLSATEAAIASLVREARAWLNAD